MAELGSPLSFLAGSIAGAAGTLVGHPLDTVKLYAQTGARPPKFSALFRGVSAPVAMAGVLQSLNLGVYENCRRGLWRGNSTATPLWCHAVAGSTGGLAISVISSPLNRIKVQQQLGGQSFGTTARAIAAGGTLYHGFGLTCAFELSRGFYMVAYTLLKRIMERADRSKGTTLPVWARTVAGAGANVLVWALVYPLDVVRSVQQAAPPRLTAPVAVATTTAPLSSPVAVPRTALECARALVAEAGWVRLYRGYAVTMVRAGPVAGIILPTFEVVLAALDEHAGVQAGDPGRSGVAATTNVKS